VVALPGILKVQPCAGLRVSSFLQFRLLDLLCFAVVVYVVAIFISQSGFVLIFVALFLSWAGGLPGNRPQAHSKIVYQQRGNASGHFFGARKRLSSLIFSGF